MYNKKPQRSLLLLERRCVEVNFASFVVVFFFLILRTALARFRQAQLEEGKVKV